MKKETHSDKSTAEKIIETAIALFARKGYAAVSVKELAEEAGVNIALISYYFGGKEKLYTLALETQFELADIIMNTVNSMDSSPIEKIRYFTREFARMNNNNPYTSLIYGEILNPSPCFDAVVKPRIVRFHSFLCDHINAAIVNGEFRSDLDSHSAALALGSLIHFCFSNREVYKELLPEGENQIENYVCKAVEDYFRGVLNQSSHKN